MLRWHIVRTLLYKECLRYRYNWGLLVVVLALLVLSFLVSISSRFKTMFRTSGTKVEICHILYDPDDERDIRWQQYLTAHPPERSPGEKRKIEPKPYHTHADYPEVPSGAMAIELNPKWAVYTQSRLEKLPTDVWKVRFWYAEQNTLGTVPYHNWLMRRSQEFLNAKPIVKEETVLVQEGIGSEAEQVPLVVTALALFALYLLSFNLYITSTGEEREKRLLLGLLLSPASPGEIITAKALFYATGSLVVSLAVVGMYQPRLLANGYLWTTIIAGSVGYVAIGTVVISIVRRQTTINTISMLYLIATTIIMLLGELLPLFNVMKLLLIENYLYNLMRQIVTGTETHTALKQAMLIIFASVWTLIAVRIFTRQGMAISRSR